jgi:trehalose 6-phosphate phosphatase
MKYILARQNVDLLAQLAWARVLLAFDFDGTLAPIVHARRRAGMRARTSTLLQRASALYPCAVITGRSCEDVRARLPSSGVKYVVGNHGLEPGRDLAGFEREIARAAQELAQALSLAHGIELENKRYSLAMHYRRARNKDRARTEIHAALAALAHPLRSIPGKLVVNAVPHGAPNKGDALVALRKQEGADTALYVGDDVTDEDVFELDQPGRLLGIRVGHSRRSAARYYLRDQREIDALLARLCELRAQESVMR